VVARAQCRGARLSSPTCYDLPGNATFQSQLETPTAYHHTTLTRPNLTGSTDSGRRYTWPPSDLRLRLPLCPPVPSSCRAGTCSVPACC
jgi:hypothetical protein